MLEHMTDDDDVERAPRQIGVLQRCLLQPAPEPWAERVDQCRRPVDAVDLEAECSRELQQVAAPESDVEQPRPGRARPKKVTDWRGVVLLDVEQCALMVDRIELEANPP